MIKHNPVTLVRIDKEVHSQFKANCARAGLSMSSVINKLVSSWSNQKTWGHGKKKGD